MCEKKRRYFVNANRRTVIVLMLLTIMVSISGICSAIPIGLKSGRYDPDLSGPPAPDQLAYGAMEMAPTDFFIVQFDQPISPEMRASLVARGARILRYLPMYAYIAKMSGAECQQLIEENVLYHVVYM